MYYSHAKIIRRVDRSGGAFRSQLNIYDGASFAKIVNDLAVNYFQKRSSLVDV